MYYFSNFPKVHFQLFGEDSDWPIRAIKNIALRFRVQQIIRDRVAYYYDYILEDHERLDMLAYDYYEDPSLDWIIAVTNDIMDIDNDLPMEYSTWRRYLVKKYGAVSTAKGTTHHYELILNEQSRLADGTIIPERYVTIDETTYNDVNILASKKRIIDSYTYEERLNDAKRNIKLPDQKFIPGILSAADRIFRVF